MSLNLSSFLQWKLNIFLYLTFGWSIAKFLIFSLGRLHFSLNGNEKNRITRAVEEVIGKDCEEQELKQITSDVFKGILSHYYEKMFIAFEEVDKATSFLHKNIMCERLEVLREKLKRGKGVIIVTGHYGAIEYIPTLLAVNGFPVSMIAKFKTERLKKKSSPRPKNTVSGFWMPSSTVTC